MLLSMKMYTQESSSEVSYKNRCFSTGGLQGHVFCGLLVSMLEITFLSPISYSTDWVTKCSSTVKADLFGEGFILHLGSTINMCSVAAMLSYMVCMTSVSFSVADVRVSCKETSTCSGGHWGIAMSLRIGVATVIAHMETKSIETIPALQPLHNVPKI